MRLVFGHIADYVTTGINSKLIVVGIFDGIIAPRFPDGRLLLPPCQLVIALDVSVAEGSDHAVTLHLVDDDGTDVVPPFTNMVRFRPTQPGHPLAANLTVNLAGLTVPDPGDYEFRVWTASGDIGGAVPLTVSEAPAAPPQL